MEDIKPQLENEVFLQIVLALEGHYEQASYAINSLTALDRTDRKALDIIAPVCGILGTGFGRDGVLVPDN